jgi:hypothetical protein
MRRHLDQETDLEAEEPELVLDQKEEHMPVSGTRALDDDEELDPTRPRTHEEVEERELSRLALTAGNR